MGTLCGPKQQLSSFIFVLRSLSYPGMLFCEQFPKSHRFTPHWFQEKLCLSRLPSLATETTLAPLPPTFIPISVVPALFSDTHFNHVFVCCPSFSARTLVPWGHGLLSVLFSSVIPVPRTGTVEWMNEWTNGYMNCQAFDSPCTETFPVVISALSYKQ